MIELILIAGFVILRYGVADTVASYRGQPTARAADRVARQEAAAKVAHERRQMELGPTVGQALAARIAQRIAPHGDRPTSHREPGPLRRMLSAWWADVCDDADRRHAIRRANRLNDRRVREGQDPIVWDADIDADADIVDAEIVDDDPEPEPARRTSWPCLRRCGHANPYPDTVCAHCVIAEQAVDNTATPPHGMPPVPPTPDGEPSTPEAPEPTPAPEEAVEWDEDNPGPCRTPNCDRTSDCPQGFCYSCDHGAYPCVQCDRRGGLDAADRCFICAADAAAGGPPFTCPQCHTTPVEHAVRLCGPCIVDPDRGPTNLTAPETPAPAPAPATTEGTPMSQPNAVINGDINDPTGARRYTVANSSTLRDVADQFELMIARAKAGGLGDAAVGELVQARADITTCADTVDQATTEFEKQVALQANIASHEDLGGTVKDTWTDGNRAS